MNAGVIRKTSVLKYFTVKIISTRIDPTRELTGARGVVTRVCQRFAITLRPLCAEIIELSSKPRIFTRGEKFFFLLLFFPRKAKKMRPYRKFHLFERDSGEVGVFHSGKTRLTVPFAEELRREDVRPINSGPGRRLVKQNNNNRFSSDYD